MNKELCTTCKEALLEKEEMIKQLEHDVKVKERTIEYLEGILASAPSKVLMSTIKVFENFDKDYAFTTEQIMLILEELQYHEYTFDATKDLI